MDRLTVVGGGAWGRALASQAVRAGRRVTLASRTETTLANVRTVGLDEATAAKTDALVLAVPSAATVEVAARFAPTLAPGTIVVLTAKGLDADGPRLLSEAVAATLLGATIVVLSGPSFADEVALGLPTAVVVAAVPVDAAAAERVARAFHAEAFRPYVNDDPVGVQIAGAAKNVVAIACGMARGVGFGANAEAALLTRGLSETSRLGLVLGAKPATFRGLAGVGDLSLTCAGPHSRNFRFGEAVGLGQASDAAEATSGLAEGRAAAPLLVHLAAMQGIEMPIAAAVAAVLAGRIGLGDAIRGLLARPLTSED
ncbi:MAG: NAD(P)H-dependent glycerol-3-phosphate dehydrogenase [Pseudomonadota bacterium]